MLNALINLENFLWRTVGIFARFLRRFAVMRMVNRVFMQPVLYYFVHRPRVRLRSMLGRRIIAKEFPTAPPGSPVWLMGTEIKYGGLVKFRNTSRGSLERRKHYPYELGGDRMLHNGYAAKYSEHLFRYIGRNDCVNLAEFGILSGTGMAIWCELFPHGRMLGLDIDLSRIRGNMDNLRTLGAFEKNHPEFHEYDQFLDNTEHMGKILKNDLLDICIDDGFHSTETILMTMKSVMPYLADRFVYFVEDHPYVHMDIRASYPDLQVESAGHLTIISRGAGKEERGETAQSR